MQPECADDALLPCSQLAAAVASAKTIVVTVANQTDPDDASTVFTPQSVQALEGDTVIFNCMLLFFVLMVRFGGVRARGRCFPP